MSPDQFQILAQRAQRNYLFRVVLDDVVGVSPRDVEPLCVGLQFGDYSIDQLVTIQYGHQVRSYAGFFAVSTVGMKFLMPSPDVVSPYFRAWRDRVVDPKGYYHAKDHYARQVTVILLSTDLGTAGLKLKMTGCFPKTYPRYDVSNSSEGVHYIDVSISVDTIEPE